MDKSYSSRYTRGESGSGMPGAVSNKSSRFFRYSGSHTTTGLDRVAAPPPTRCHTRRANTPPPRTHQVGSGGAAARSKKGRGAAKSDCRQGGDPPPTEGIQVTPPDAAVRVLITTPPLPRPTPALTLLLRPRRRPGHRTAVVPTAGLPRVPASCRPPSRSRLLTEAVTRATVMESQTAGTAG